MDARVRMYDKVFAGQRVFGVTIAEVHEGHGGAALYSSFLGYVSRHALSPRAS